MEREGDGADGDAPRTDTAVSPVIRGEPVDIPTPIWGALVQEDMQRLAAGGEHDPADPGADGELHLPPRRLLGWLSLLAFVVTAVLHGVAVDVAAHHDPAMGGFLAWSAIITSLAAVGLGVTAAILDRGRTLGIIGAVCGLLANPWVVLVVLRLFAP